MGVTESEKELAHAYAAVLIGEIKAEMGRRDVRGVRDLARRVGMSHETLRSRLNNSTAFTTEEIWRLCRVLTIEPWDLFHQAGVQFDKQQAAAAEEPGA